MKTKKIAYFALSTLTLCVAIIGLTSTNNTNDDLAIKINPTNYTHKIIDFNDRAIDIEIVLMPVGIDSPNLIDNLLEVGQHRIAWDHLKAKFFQQIKASGMGLNRFALDLLDVENKDRKLTRGRNLRILLAKAARRSVSGILKRFFIVFKLDPD